MLKTAGGREGVARSMLDCPAIFGVRLVLAYSSSRYMPIVL